MFKTLKDMDFKGKKVLVRVDFNTPLDKEGNISDDSRIKAAVPTIDYILAQGAKQILLLTHLGRPAGETEDNLKTDILAVRLGRIMKKPVFKVNDCIDIALPEQERIIMLENVRFRKAEKEDSDNFAQALARQADIYVNDAFGTCHRRHASVHAITKFLPSCAGLLLEKEVSELGKAIKNPERPFIVIIGGAKLETKIPVIENMLDKADKLLVGGGMVFTFFKAQGFEIGRSIADQAEFKTAKKIMDNAGDRLFLPTDIVVSPQAEKGAPSRVVGITGIPEDMMGLDIGPETTAFFIKEIKKAKTIVWNGTLGMNEIEDFAKGSRAIAKALASSPAETIIGGGDTVGFVKQLKLEKKMSHVSTGGGASLEFLGGRALPALEALEEAGERAKQRPDKAKSLEKD